MSSSKGFRTPDASDKPERGEINLSLRTVHRMLPLVQRIVDDILQTQKTLARLQPEDRRSTARNGNLPGRNGSGVISLKMNWPRPTCDGKAHLAELRELGVIMLDHDQGRVGFPTLVNNRRAFFSWHPGEAGLHSWQFADEDLTRPIPLAWLKEVSLTRKA